MPSLYHEATALARWPTAERLRALKRVVPRARIHAVLRRTGHARRRYLRLPAWFMVWFVIALGLFCRDSYRQVFKWLQPFRRHGTPGRSTLCEARQRLGVAPLLQLAQQVVELRERRQVEDALRLIRGGVIDAGTTASSRRVLLQHGPLCEEPNLGEPQEDQAENRLRVLS